jgi:hypothetical protein
MASFITRHLAEQFWSVNLLTAAFGVLCLRKGIPVGLSAVDLLIANLKKSQK